MQGDDGFPFRLFSGRAQRLAEDGEVPPPPISWVHAGPTTATMVMSEITGDFMHAVDQGAAAMEVDAAALVQVVPDDEDGGADEQDTPVGDLIETNDELEELGIIISAAAQKITIHKYAETTINKLRGIMETIAVSQSHVAQWIESTAISQTTADAARIMLNDIHQTWNKLKPDVQLFLSVPAPAKRAFLLSDYGSSGAGADSPERATGARRWS